MNDEIAVAHLRRRVRAIRLFVLLEVMLLAPAVASVGMLAWLVWSEAPPGAVALDALVVVLFLIPVGTGLWMGRGLARIHDRVVVTADGVGIGRIAVMPFWAIERCDVRGGVLTLETPVTAVDYDVEPGSPFVGLLESAWRTWRVLHPAVVPAGPFRLDTPEIEWLRRLAFGGTLWCIGAESLLLAVVAVCLGSGEALGVALGVGALGLAGTVGAFRWVRRFGVSLLVGPDATLVDQHLLPFDAVTSVSREGGVITVAMGKGKVRFTDGGDSGAFDALLAAWSKR